MKYIRTKDRIYEVYFENKKGCNVNTRHFLETGQGKLFIHNFISNENIINQADTIEELCDDFVAVVEKETKGYLIYNQCGNSFEKVKMINKNAKENNVIIYGAIWTDKGLIYVAKMNKNGELCLI